MHYYDGKTLLINNIFMADDYNEVVRKYSNEMDGFSHYFVDTGDLVSASILNDLINNIRDYANQNGYSVGGIPNNLNIGDLIPIMSWGEAIWNSQPVIELTAGQYTYIAPKGSRHLRVEWLMAAGGGGGGGNETQGGYSGGGGGSGGYQQNVSFDIVPNQSIYFDIGKGGIGGSGIGTDIGGLKGEDSFLSINNNEVIRVTGGGGGSLGNENEGHLNSNGGLGGNPGGQNGGDGVNRATEDDHLGGAGGNTPLGQGGQPTWDDVAQSGSGYGTGGAGGCTRDRHAPHIWKGGNGATGYVKFQFTR